MNRARLDFFDVDHTVTRHATGSRFMLRAIARGLAPERVLERCIEGNTGPRPAHLDP